MKFFPLYLVSAFLLLVGFLVVPQSVHALTISPVRIEVSVDPGTTYSGTYELINNTDNVRTYYNTFENFEADGESGVPAFSVSDEGLASWLSGPAAITLSPKERVDVPFTVTIPDGVEPGGYFSAIFWGTQTPNESITGAQVSAKVGILLLLRVNGDIFEDGGIVSFDADKSFSTVLPLAMSYRFRNDGNDRLKPSGVVEITNIFGNTVESLDANTKKGNVLPLSKRAFDVYWTDDVTSENTGFFANVNRQIKDFRFGKYTATLLLTYGNEVPLSDAASVSVWIIPFELLLIVLVVVLLLLIAFVLIKKQYNKSIAKQVAALTDAKKKKTTKK